MPGFQGRRRLAPTLTLSTGANPRKPLILIRLFGWVAHTPSDDAYCLEEIHGPPKKKVPPLLAPAGMQSSYCESHPGLSGTAADCSVWCRPNSFSLSRKGTSIRTDSMRLSIMGWMKKWLGSNTSWYTGRTKNTPITSRRSLCMPSGPGRQHAPRTSQRYVQSFSCASRCGDHTL